MKLKLGVLFLVAVIASAGMGLSYAIGVGGGIVGGVPSCYCDVAFVGTVVATDNEVEKDIGYVEAHPIDGYNDYYNGIRVNITHAYPCYAVYIDFTVYNAGEQPIDVNGITVRNYDTSAMSASLSGDLAGVGSLAPGESKDGRLTITVLNGAVQNGYYWFEIGLGFKNEECPQLTHVDTVTVDANNPNPTTSSINLVDGVDYILVATGTAFAGDTIDFDAKYSITHRISGDTWTDVVTGYESYGTILLNLLVDGIEVDWGAFNVGHKYECTITGDGTPVELLIYDIYYPNNVGSLTVDIYEVS